MCEIRKKAGKIVRLPLLLLLAISISLAALPAIAYDVVVPGDLNGDMIVSDEELETAQSSYDDGKITSEELEKIEHINENYPRTIIDSAGREVTLYKPIERIVTREPDTCRIVVALGDGDKVVASEQMTKSCLCSVDWGSECYYTILGGQMPDLPETSTRYDIYYEQMAALTPDVIITSSTTDAQEFEDKVGCPCVVASGRGWTYSYDEGGLYNQIEVIGDLLEREDEADELIGFIESKLDMIRSVTDTLDESEKPTVYYASRGASKGFYDPKEGRDFTRTEPKYEPIDIAGGINVAAECEGTSINVGIEQIIAWDPDYILLASSSSQNNDSLGFILASPELQSISAIQNGNVYYCFSPHCRGTPPDRSLFNVIYMAKLFHPEEFKDLDLEKEGNEIFKAFLGVDGVFTDYADYLVWMREWLDSQ
jgi:iron complex transport system substrate-binding protein